MGVNLAFMARFLSIAFLYVVFCSIFVDLGYSTNKIKGDKNYLNGQNTNVSLENHRNAGDFDWREYLGNLDCSPFQEENKTAFVKYNATGRITLEKNPNLSMKCEDIRRRITRLSTNSEIANPLAVARNVYEDYYLQEILLAQSYSPSNAFCYAIDVKSSAEFKTSMAQMASCLPNVVILNDTFKFDSGGHFQNHAHYACMRKLISFSDWKYVILLQNAEVFIKTPQEISKILGILNGAPLFSLAKVWNNRVPKLNITAKSMGLFLNEANKTKEQLETVFKFRKSAVSMLLPRSFIQEIVQSLNLTRILNAFNNEKVFATDEYFFPTLVSAHFLKLPGQVENGCLTGHALSICLLGVEYLKTLQDSNFIIANKVWPKFDFGAIMCIDKLFHGNNIVKRDWNKITSFYNNFTHIREWKLRNSGAFNITTFKC